MIIVSGAIVLRPGQRGPFLEGARAAMEAARKTQGCSAFVVAADPLEADLAIVYEAWESEAELLAFRGKGPSADVRAMIAESRVRRYEVVQTGPA